MTVLPLSRIFLPVHQQKVRMPCQSCDKQHDNYCPYMHDVMQPVK